MKNTLKQEKEKAIASINDAEVKSIMVISTKDISKMRDDEDGDGVVLNIHGKNTDLSMCLAFLMFESEEFKQIIAMAAEMLVDLEEDQISQN